MSAVSTDSFAPPDISAAQTCSATARATIRTYAGTGKSARRAIAACKAGAFRVLSTGYVVAGNSAHRAMSAILAGAFGILAHRSAIAGRPARRAIAACKAGASGVLPIGYAIAGHAAHRAITALMASAIDADHTGKAFLLGTTSDEPPPAQASVPPERAGLGAGLGPDAMLARSIRATTLWKRAKGCHARAALV